MTLRIQLDSVRKYRNANEWRNVNRATCEDLEVVGDGNIESQLARKLIEAGHSGDVEVWRGDMMCFRAVPLEKWAAGAVGKGEQPAWLRRAE